MDREEIIRHLTAEAGYTPLDAAVVASDLLRCRPDIQAAFADWRATGRLPDLEAAGYTAQMLVADYGFRPVAALLTLDWLLSEPDEALAALRHEYGALPASRNLSPDGANITP